MDFKKLLEKYKMHYRIAYLRHQQGKTFKEIANQFDLSVSRVEQKYQKFLYVLYNFYIQYLRSKQVEFSKWEIYEFYISVYFSVAYLEKTYKVYLDSLRCGVPPIVFQEHMNIPPFRNLTAEKIIELEKHIIEARERQKRTFSDIGKELELTKEKVKCIYDFYYHKKILAAFERIKPAVDFPIESYVFNYSHASYKRWNLIVDKYEELVKDLID